MKDPLVRLGSLSKKPHTKEQVDNLKYGDTPAALGAGMGALGGEYKDDVDKERKEREDSLKMHYAQEFLTQNKDLFKRPEILSSLEGVDPSERKKRINKIVDEAFLSSAQYKSLQSELDWLNKPEEEKRKVIDDSMRSSLRKQTDELDKRISERMSAAYQVESQKDRDEHKSLPLLARIGENRAKTSPFQRTPETGNYATAKSFINDTKSVIEEYDKREDGNLKSAGRGLRKALFDIDTWAYGVTNADREGRIKATAEKFEKGEELSESEQAMMDALAVNLATNSYFGDKSRGHTWGQIAGESLPFMIEFVLNPIAGGGKGLAKSIAKYGIQKLGAKGAGKVATKAAARTVGDLIGAAGMTVTTGALGTGADALSRMAGDATFEIDDEGNASYAGHEGGKEAGEAIGKAFTARLIEYQSEMLGNSGIGGLVGKALPKGRIKATGFGKLVGRMNNSDIVRNLKSIENRAQWSGVLGEFGEEYYGTAANALIVGDSKFSDLVDVDQQIDTFMGLALTGGAMSSLNTTGYAVDRVKTNRSLNTAEKAAAQYIQDWESVKPQLENLSVQERSDVLKGIIQREDVSIPAKNALTGYITTLTYKESLSSSADEIRKQNEAKGRETGAKLYETIQDKRSVSLFNLNTEKQTLEAELGDLINVPLSEIEETQTPEIIEAARRYNVVQSEYQGVLDQLYEEVDNHLKPQLDTIDSVTREDGNIFEVNLGDQINPDMRYVMRGNIVLNEDGSINRMQSDKILYAVDNDGRKSQVGISKIQSAHFQNANDAKHMLKEMAYQQFVDPLADRFDGIRRFEPEEQVEFTTEKGETIAGTVAMKQGETVTVVDAEGKSTTHTESDLNNMLVAPVLGEYRVRDQIDVAIDGEVFPAEITEISDGKATLHIPTAPDAAQRFMDVDLPQLNSMVSHSIHIDETSQKEGENETSSQGGQNELQEKGQIEEQKDNSIAQEWERQNFTPEEIAQRREYGITPEMEYETTYRGVSAKEWESIQEGGTFQSSGLSDGVAFFTPNRSLSEQSGSFTSAELVIELKPESRSKMTEGDSKLGSVEYYGRGITIDDVHRVYDAQGNIVYESTQKREFPRDKKGEIDYEQITDDAVFLSALESEFGDERSEIIEDYKKQAEKKLKDAGRIQDPIRRKRAQREAQANVDRFTSMYDTLNPKTAYEQRIESIEIGKIKDRESNMGEYLSLHDYLLRNIATGQFKFLWNNDGVRKGLAGEILANKNNETERRKRISFLDNAGFTPETLAEYIAENAGEGSEISPAWFADESEIRDEIIDILLRHDTPTSMLDAATEIRRQPESIEEFESLIDPAVIEEHESRETEEITGNFSLPFESMSDQELENYFNEIEDEQGTRVEDHRGDTVESGELDGRSAESSELVGEVEERIDTETTEEAREDGEQRAPGSVEQSDTEIAKHEPSGDAPIESASVNESIDRQVDSWVNLYNEGKLDELLSDATLQRAGSNQAYTQEFGRRIGFEFPWEMTSKAQINEVKKQLQKNRELQLEANNVDQNPTEAQERGSRSESQYELEKADITRKIDELIKEREERFPNPDIESPMSVEEKALNSQISRLQSQRDKLVREKRKANRRKSESYGESNTIISQDRYEELKKQMRDQLNKLSSGFNPEILSIGAQMAMYHIEAGARKFRDFSKRMVDDLGDAIRPYLKASYEGARQMPGMEELSKTMDPYNDVLAFDVNQSFEEAKIETNINKNEQGERSTETIEAETAVVETASETIERESENVGSDKQRAGEVIEKATEQIEKAETLLNEIDKKLANLKLAGKEYTTEGILADYPVNILAKGPIKKDATSFVKSVAKITGLEHDTNSKGKRQIVDVNIPPAGGNATFILWGKKNPDYGVYVSIPYQPEYTRGRNNYDNYKVDGSILWRVTTRKDKYRGLGNQRMKADVTAQEMAEILLKGLNSELRFRKLEQETNDVEKTSEKVKKPSKKSDNQKQLSIFEDANNNKDDRTLQANSNRLPRREPSGVLQGTEGRGRTGRSSDQPGAEVSASDGAQQQSRDGEGGLLPRNVDVLSEQPALVEFVAESNDTETFNKNKKYADNISAIETLLSILREDRKATPQEKTILSKYVGFGGLKEILLDPNNDSAWKTGEGNFRESVRRTLELSNEFDELAGTSGTFEKIRGSILNAHYTSKTVIDAIYKGLNKLGFKGGNILEPSAGIGNFLTYMPASIKGKSSISAVELDNLTGNILKALHDNVNVQISGIETANIAPGSQDLVISNVPFGNYKVYDKTFKGEKEKLQNRIHNYFFAKALDQVRDGGLVAFVTSKGVLDAPGNSEIREYLNKNAEFLGAVRLPNNTFKNTANTEVVTDVIFLRKTNNPNNPDFVNVAEVDAKHRDGEIEKVSVNQYFVDNPQNMLGDIEAGGMYSRRDYTLKDNGTAKDLDKVIRDALPSNVYSGRSAMGLQANDLNRSFDDVKEGNIAFEDGKLYKKEDGRPVEIKINEPDAKIKSYIDLRNSLMDLIYSEYANFDKETVNENRKKLNDLYDGFVKKYGSLEKSISKIIKQDADGYNVLSLENDGKKADIFTKRTISPVNMITRTESIDEAIVISLSETAGIDMERICQLLGMNLDEVKSISKGKIFEKPEGGYATRDEYLSGNVKQKLKEAKQAVESGFTEFQYNVEELERVIPADIPAVQIESRLGSRWIPASVYTEFARELLKDDNLNVSYSQGVDQYFINQKPRTVEATKKYGTDRVNGADILLGALHINPPKVYDYYKEDGKQKRELNQAETDKAVQKYQEVRDLFEDWVYKAPDRRELLSGIYNERFNTTVKRKYDGSHLTIPGINNVNLRPHQKDAVWMLLQNNGGVIDHLVGAGKTYVMVAGTMEMKRTGVSKKPMIMALKSTIPQIVETYRAAYPMAKILAPMEKDFQKDNRMKLFSKIANNEWDVIIMSHENYGKIPHEREIQERLINQELEELEKERAEFETTSDRAALKGLEIRIKNLEARLEKLSDIDKDNSLTFEQMGIDHIMVDESQQFKNLSYITKQRGIAGLGNAEGSKRSFNLLVGIRYLQDKLNGDKGATFLSGTPITNSIVEMYSLFNYLRPTKMAELGFTSFDAWATTFANPTTDIEFTVTGNFKQKTRFREFMNVPELSMLYTEIADIRTDDNLKLDKPKMKGNGYSVIEVKMSEEQKEFSERLMKFAETKDGELIGRGPLSDNEKSAAMLLATNLSSKMAIDMRLIDPSYPYDQNGKIAKLVENVVRTFNETADLKGTQLILSDLGTPKNASNKSGLLRDYLEDEQGLNIDSLNEIFGDVSQANHRYPALSTARKRMIETLELTEAEADQIIIDSENSVGTFDVYNEVKKRLIEQGVPEDQVVFIHDYNTARRKEALFNKVNNGDIRIILGSTQKLGTGVNIQERVVAVHHVDVPWTPASMEQRNGRALRQGNKIAKEFLNNEIPVYAYATERTLDAYKYQLLQTKQTFLNQVKSGEVTDRVIKEGEGDSESGVGYAELVAMLSGNQDILKKSRLEDKLSRLKRLRRNFEGELYESIEQKRRIEERIPEIEENIKKSEQNIKSLTEKAQFDESGKLIIETFNGQQIKPKKEKGKEIPVERTDYAKAALDHIEKRMKRMEFGEMDRFEIGGYNIEYYIVPAGDVGLFSTNKKANASLVAPNGVKYAINVSTIPGVFLNNIQKAITDQIPNNLISQRNLLEREKRNLAAYEEIIERGDQWPRQQEYDDVSKELKEVTERLDADIKNNEVRLRASERGAFPYGLMQNELYDKLDDHAEWSNGSVNLVSALEDYFKGELIGVSEGGKRAIEDYGMIPVPGTQYSGTDGEYHHISFKKDSGEVEVEAVPFVRAEEVEEVSGIRFRQIQGTSGSFGLSELRDIQDRFDNPASKRHKYHAAVEMVELIEKMFKPVVPTVVVNSKQEMAQVLRNHGFSEDIVTTYENREGEIQGMYLGEKVIINANDIHSSGDLLDTWIHETRHAYDDVNAENIVSLQGKISEEAFKEILPKGYWEENEYNKISEVLAFLSEEMINGEALPDYDVIKKEVEPTIIDFLNYISDGRFSTNREESLRKRETSSGSIEDNKAGPRNDTGDVQKRAHPNRQRSSQRNNRRGDGEVPGYGEHERGVEKEDGRIIGGEVNKNIRVARIKADNIFNSVDDLSQSIPDYSGFLGEVFNGVKNKSEILSEARSRGLDFQGAVEKYLSEIEDSSELDRVRKLLDVEMPDNALRYALWRNVNPNDGSVEWKAKDALKTRELNPNVLFRKGTPPTSLAENEYERRVRSRYNKGFKSLMFGIEEGWLDRMTSLRILQEAITGKKDIPDRANAYMIENQLSSKNTAEIKYYEKNLLDPMYEAVVDVFGKDLKQIDDYLLAKHGLERNEKMARAEAERWVNREIGKLNLPMDEAPTPDQVEAIEAIKADGEFKYEELLAKKDYSGLTALAEERDLEETFTEAAENVVNEIEDAIDKEKLDAVWESINKATKWMLRKQYDSGMMTKETFNHINTMYDYYVPLRGFSETTAEDLYEYILNQPSEFNQVLKTARGRTSRSESPFASILNMAESGIMQSNRNRMKQAFYRLVATNPSNYATINDVWLVKKGDGWVEEFPDIPENATGDQVASVIAEFNDKMNELASEGEAVKGRNKLDFGVKIGKAQASEHAVRVWIGGEEKVIYINGNPRAAQAINGLTNPNSKDRRKILSTAQFWMRQMSANFTSRNPAFMVTNFMRDIQFALVSAAVKEGGRYSAQLGINATQVPKTIALNIWGEGGGKFDNYWNEFISNGGETGYANLHSMDYHRKYVNKKLRQMSGQRDFIAPFRSYVEFVGNANRLIEDISRFATYVTSRQAGRSIEKSVADAKDITINFNRKGSGGFGADIIHNFVLFSNPALQSMRQMGMMAKRHPKRFTAALSMSAAMGFMAPLINEFLLGMFGDDDDQEAYRNLSDWTKRNHLVLYTPWMGSDKFLTLALPHELRGFYGLGEMAYSANNGMLRNVNVPLEATKQLFNMLPLDPTGGRTSLVPDVVRPFVEAYWFNRNFMDRPIYKDTPWNKLDPEWTKAYKGTSPWLVEGAKWLNEVSGGDDVVKGKIDLNPAQIQHVFGGYVGGAWTTYTDLVNVAYDLISGEGSSINQIPVANKLVRTSDDRTKEGRINNEYFFYLDWMRDYEHRERGYDKRLDDKKYQEKYRDLLGGDETAMYQYGKIMSNLINDAMDHDEEGAKELKEEFVNRMWEMQVNK